MLTTILGKIFGTSNDRQLRKLLPIVEQINALEPTISALSDDQLAQKTIYFKETLAQGATLDDILPEAFAVVRETSRRKLGMRHFDVQLMGGIVLHQGKIAEMKTGEGKTLTATLPLYLNALTGNGVHLVTVNDYLARRDAQWMSPIYTFLGLSVGVLQHNMSDEERKAVYNCDVLYATNNELGFDYLRDNMKFRLEDYVQRELNYAIVDEVDSILIDEARTPLIISGPSEASSSLYETVDRIVARLVPEQDYQIDIKERSVTLTEAGIDRVEQALNVANLYAIENINMLHHVSQALRAHAIFKRDVDYIVDDNQVLIVDEFTGRILAGRRFSDGLHQALEAKEGVTVERETQTLASITLQNFFRLYTKLAGMTGTAMTEAEEFHKIYKLDVVAIPTHMPMIRTDKQDLIFLTKNAKFKSIVQDVKERYTKGQPVLIGTIAVETSELLSHLLRMNGIPHEVLNAKQHQREAEIVEHAGEAKRITIATNMAGRGTDIKLTPESRELGGLYILGTERHESRRIDNQLRGRSGRQGDMGESRFYISLEDDLIRRFSGGGGNDMKRRMEFFRMSEDEIIEHPWVSRMIETAQKKVEQQNFKVREHLLEYDDVLNQHRAVIYKYRRDILEGAQQSFELVQYFIRSAIETLFADLNATATVTAEQVEQILKTVATITGLDRKLFDEAQFSTSSGTAFAQQLINFLTMKYELYRTEGDDIDRLQEAEKWLMLETIDNAWKQHMLNIDHLKEGIWLRSHGQKNPLIEYKKEAFAMFQDMIKQIQWEIVHRLFHLNIERFNQRELEQRRERELDQMRLIAGDSHGNEQPVVAQRLVPEEERTGRNDPCPCGSGKKYKKCHGK